MTLRTRRRGLLAMVATATCVGLVLAGCSDASKTARGPHADKASTTPAHPAPSTATPAAVKRCVARQINAFHALSRPITNAADRVWSSRSFVSAAADSYLRRLVDRSLERVRADCAVRPKGMLRFVRRIHQIAERGRPVLGNGDLLDVALAYIIWAEAIFDGPHEARPFLNKLNLCRRTHSHLRATYSISTREAEYGKDVWVDWKLHNRMGRNAVIVDERGGTLWARGVFRKFVDGWDKTRDAAVVRWGGSRSESGVVVPPGQTRGARIAVGPRDYLPMRSDGEIVDVRPVLWYQWDTQQGDFNTPYCSLVSFPKGQWHYPGLHPTH